ncbi:hypothetical protein JOC86_000747 [Bacillus pakistanensis]|uniref:Uncharacterized protein n=1 Tax=Rossellomorea pakistanensis TaxID=992288 RepID=A0ABS2N8M3_9BACI|nr:hypothetical protein [Bacillus pakistanensis]MBM7584210.1 hypothetical protein [Bacillus pakistanensis]
MNDDKLLLQSYNQLWNNRTLPIDTQAPLTVLLDAITRELLDENSHPRVRKAKEVKFFFAIKRISASALPSEVKLQLINLHIQVLTQLRE